ncbi:MAG: hypothetical protein HYZ49_03690 [Chloroflexi bacterium]|nr:hypothetical protein [Chloroflexota bacterium]
MIHEVARTLRDTKESFVKLRALRGSFLVAAGSRAMILDTLPKKSVLAVLIACGGIVWLNEWHQFAYSRSPINFPPVSNWLRDSMFVLIPVALAIWIGIALSQWLIDRFGGRMSPSAQSMLTAAILGGATSFAIILMEAGKIFQTGIGTEFAFLASICRSLYPDGNLLLSILQGIFPSTQAFRFHILLQDGFNLALANLTITILVIIILEGFVRGKIVFDHKMGRVGVS